MNRSGNRIRTAGIVLAAGSGRRFGRTKQLAQLGGRPLLEHALEAMEESPLDDRIVVLGADAELIRKTVPLHGARVVICEAWEEGQARSLATGLEAAGDADAAVVILGDQPGVTPESIRRVIDHERSATTAVRASYGGRPGHPVLLPGSLFGELSSLEGDSGARAILDQPGADVLTVACDDIGSGVDIDTQEELDSANEGLGIGREGATR